jgi:deoxyribodipyrimidine photo-lyase
MSNLTSPQIIWFRQDLRLADQPAVRAAGAAGPVIPIYILDDAAPGDWAMGSASRWWLHHSLTSLAADLRKKSATLVLRNGDAVQMLQTLAAETGASAIHAIGHYEPWARRQEALLAKSGLLKLHGSVALHDPAHIVTGGGTPYKVFTPFWRAMQTWLPPALPMAAPRALAMTASAPASDALESWQLLPRQPDWSAGFRSHWTPGESGARTRLADLASKASRYGETRNSLAEDGTSGLAPHLHFGEISPCQVYHGAGLGAEAFLRQLGWRDFSLNLLLMSPDFADVNWKRDFDAFPWAKDSDAFRAWSKGRTGYPVVDAAMQQLWRTGWMHNRARMIVASFLIKDLLIHWRDGERWFWDTLLDADLANNAAGWQWTAGSGADASPYYRIFNPITQGQKFDPDGAYVRRWLPQLANLPNDVIHAPWEARPIELADAGIRLGKNYPLPMVNHAAARDRALGAYKQLKASS